MSSADQLLFTTTARVYVKDTPERGGGHRLLYPAGAVIPLAEAERLGLIEAGSVPVRQPRTAKVSAPKS